MYEAISLRWDDVNDWKGEENQRDEPGNEQDCKAEINPENWFTNPLDFRFLVLRGLPAADFVPLLKLLHPQSQHENNDALEEAQAPD